MKGCHGNIMTSESLHIMINHLRRRGCQFISTHQQPNYVWQNFPVFIFIQYEIGKTNVGNPANNLQELGTAIVILKCIGLDNKSCYVEVIIQCLKVFFIFFKSLQNHYSPFVNNQITSLLNIIDNNINARLNPAIAMLQTNIYVICRF